MLQKLYLSAIHHSWLTSIKQLHDYNGATEVGSRPKLAL